MAEYDSSTNSWTGGKSITLLASAERTSAENGDAVYVGNRATVRLELDVTAVGADANETLDVSVETSEDGSTGWAEVGAFTQVPQTGGATSERLIFGECDRYVRAVVAVGGTTPEFTFSVAGEAV